MAPLTLKKRDRILIIPFPILILMGAFFVGAAFLLIPKEEELLHRFIEDKNAARAKDLYKNVMGTEIAEAAQALVQSVRDKGATESPESTSQKSPSETLATFLGSGTCRPADVTFPDLINAVRSEETPAAEPLLEMLLLASAEKALAPDDWNTLQATIAEKALAESNPELAADLLLDVCRPESLEPGNWDRLRMAVQSCRWSAKPGEAANLLSQFETTSLPEDIVNLHVAVLQELGKNKEAFSVITRYIDALDENTPIPDSLMKSLEQAGTFSGQVMSLMPIYRRHLAATEIGQMPWEDFLAAADAGDLPQKAPYSPYAKKFAQFCEWNALPAEAFDHYGKLAVMGDAEATARCLVLYLGLARQWDMEEILARNVASPDGTTPEIRRLHLKLIGENGNYEAAIPAYQNWLAENPGDADAWMELALIYDEMGDFQKSLETCQEAIKTHGKHVQLRTHAARILQSLGRYDEALAIWREFAPDEHDPTTREDYELLSEATGAWVDLNKAIRLTIQATPKPSVEQFELLARSGELAGDTEAEITALKNGLKVHPESKILAMNLASILYDQGKHEEAVATLTAGSLKNDLAAICLLIDIGGHLPNPELIVSHIGTSAHRQFDLPAENLLELSDIYEVTGQSEAAAEIYQNLPMGPPQWEMIAELRFNQRKLDEAKRYQEMVTEHSTDHAAWMFLGEILQEMGDAPGAEKAFKKSLTLLRSRIVSENGSVAGR